jgi:hypothetical protein
MDATPPRVRTARVREGGTRIASHRAGEEGRTGARTGGRGRIRLRGWGARPTGAPRVGEHSPCRMVRGLRGGAGRVVRQPGNTKGITPSGLSEPRSSNLRRPHHLSDVGCAAMADGADQSRLRAAFRDRLQNAAGDKHRRGPLQWLRWSRSWVKNLTVTVGADGTGRRTDPSTVRISGIFRSGMAVRACPPDLARAALIPDMKPIPA